ncbi:MAG: PilZ domain-containing protein [Planctomycetota bacterium]
MGAERRAFPRYPVQGVSAEITNVIGRGSPTAGAALLNWSQGGVLLRVPTPKRRFLLGGRKPALAERDLLACTVTLPDGEPVAIKGDVRRVEPSQDDPRWLEVGLAVDRQATPPQFLVALRAAFEPRGEGSPTRATARLERWSSRTRSGVARPSAEVHAESERLRAPRRGSARLN